MNTSSVASLLRHSSLATKAEKLWRIQFAYGMPCVPISLKGPTGFDSETNGDVSMPSAGIQLVNLMTHTFKWR